MLHRIVVSPARGCGILDHTPAERADFSHRKLLSGEGGVGQLKASQTGDLSSKSATTCHYRGAVSFNPQIRGRTQE